MIWDINNSFMESSLQTMAKQPMVSEDAPTGYINYMWPTAGPQGGRHISFNVKPKGKYFEYEGHSFIKRQFPVPPHVMEAAKAMPPTDELLYVPDYNTIKDALEVSLNQPIGGEPIGETYGGVGAAQTYQFPDYGTGQTMAPSSGTHEDTCPFKDYGGILGGTFDGFEECATCQLRAKCQSMTPPPEPVQVPQPVQAPRLVQPPQPMQRPVQTPVITPEAVQPPPVPAPVMAPIPRRPQR
jgi:hypothetical protein